MIDHLQIHWPIILLKRMKIVFFLNLLQGKDSYCATFCLWNFYLAKILRIEFEQALFQLYYKKNDKKKNDNW